MVNSQKIKNLSPRSRIGKKPVLIPEGVTVQVENGKVAARGHKGELSLLLPQGFSVELAGDSLTVSGSGASANFGKVRAEIANMMTGVAVGWSKTLEVVGTGYRVSTDGQTLTLSLGFSHPINISAPPGIQFQANAGKVVVSGSDKVLVGRVAAAIRLLRPAEPYKGKGIHYEGEILLKKQGKTAKGGGVQS